MSQWRTEFRRGPGDPSEAQKFSSREAAIAVSLTSRRESIRSVAPSHQGYGGLAIFEHGAIFPSSLLADYRQSWATRWHQR